jgi:hypothetical protein
MAVPETDVCGPGFTTVTTSETVTVNVELVAEKPWESVAVTVTGYEPPVVGVPEMTPPDEIERPGGAPLNDQPVMVAPPAAPEVIAVTLTGVMAAPASTANPGGAPTSTTFSMVKTSVDVPANPAVSVACTVAEYSPPVVGVPVTTPADDSVSPGGREPPITDQPDDEMPAPPAAPVVDAVRGSDAIVVPESSDWGAVLLMVTVLWTVQGKALVDAVADWASVAVTTTE